MESIHLPVVIKEPIKLEPMAQLICHNDPFNPNDTTMLVVPIGALCSEVLKDFSYDPEYYDLVVAKNQEIMDVDFIIEEYDIVNFQLVPKGGGSGKQILTIVAMVALMYVTAGGAASLVATTFGATGGMAIAVNAAVMVAGSMLISSLFKPSIPSQPSLQSFEQSTTYGWNTSGNSLAQGNNIPVLYGTTRITPQYIGKYLETVDDKQYLKVLTALGEGPFDSITGVEINDTDILNFSDILLDTRLGTNNQTIIEDFNDTWIDQGVNKKLTGALDTDWVYAQTTGDAVNAITVGVVCPQGIFYANDSGGLSNYSINIIIEYRKVGEPAWQNINYTAYNTQVYFVDQNPSIETTYNFFSGSYQRVVADSTGPYDVYKKGIPTYSFFTASAPVYIETITSLPPGVTQKTVYPPSATLYNYEQYVFTNSINDTGAVYFSITDNKSSAIRRSYTIRNLPAASYEIRMRYYNAPSTTSRYGSSVYFEFLQEAITDDFTYPNTALLALNMLATDQLSSGLPKITCIASRITGEYGSLDNPAWACLDILMNTRYGAGIPLSRIDFQSFQDWADYCTLQDFKVNIYLDQNLTLVQTLQLLGQLGRGTVMQYGSSFTALVDKENILPTQGFLFSMGNIIQDSFTETFLPLKDRANIVEVTYYDLTNNYDRTSIEVSQGNYDLTNTVNKTSINLLGCVTRQQALRQAKYHLNQNKYLTITASWEASIDAIVCKVGDIVNVAHDVPQWGYSGRILGNTINTIIIDRDDLTIDIGKTYYIQVSNSTTDEQIYVPIISIVGDTLTTSSTLGTLGEYSVYAFGEVNRHAKKMRILSISTAGDLTRRITAIEYNDDVYNDTIDVPVPIQVQDLATKDLIISEYLKTYLDGTILPVVQLAWKGARLAYDIQYKRINDTNYNLYGTARGNSFEIPGLSEGQTYSFLVDGIQTTYTVQGKITPPPPISSLQGFEHTSIFHLTWDYPYKPLDFSHFEILLNNVYLDNSSSTSYSYNNSSALSKTFGVYAVDTTGNKSEVVNVVINTSALPSILGIKSYYVNESTVIAWDPLVDSRSPIYYEIRMGTVWENSYIIGSTTIPEYTIAANGDYMVKAHYIYADGTDLYSEVATTISITGAVLPKNIVGTYDEKATGWLGTKSNVIVNAFGDLQLDTDISTGFVYTSGTYEIPTSHIIDIGIAQPCRIWVDYKVDGVVTNTSMDTITVFNDWGNLDGYSDKFGLVVQISIAQDDGIFGDWVNFSVGSYIGRKFKFRGLFSSVDNYTTCVLSTAKFYVDMPDKLQSGNSVALPAVVTAITYPIAFQATPNLQIAIVNAVSGDTVQITGETTTGFNVVVLNAGVMVARSINWLAKGY